jgi:hypothetical protein
LVVIKSPNIIRKENIRRLAGRVVIVEETNAYKISVKQEDNINTEHRQVVCVNGVGYNWLEIFSHGLLRYWRCASLGSAVGVLQNSSIRSPLLTYEIMFDVFN